MKIYYLIKISELSLAFYWSGTVCYIVVALILGMSDTVPKKY